MPDDLIYPNGIDALTGEPLLPPLPIDVVAKAAQGQPITKEELDELQERQRCLAGDADYGVMAGLDPNDLAVTGWGVIFAFEDEARIPALREALSPLLKLRQAQAGALYRDEVLDPKFFYRPGESKNTWLARNGGAPGPVDPRKVPYYLLIVGDPARIPYSFQYQLDVAHAVGRIHFDTLEEYDSYARSVVAAEDPAHPLALARQAAFFGALNGMDQATTLSSAQLIDPLAATFQQKLSDWQVQSWTKAAASKDQLVRLLGGDDTPAFLFSASHGMGFSQSGHPRQRREQGAVVCSDWSGRGPVGETMRLSADDIANDARLSGLIAFLFACYGAGTPRFDDFAIKSRQKELADRGEKISGLEQFDRVQIAPDPFVACLPQRLLGHPRGGALAVVGHVDRAWGASFMWEGARQLTTFESALTRLLQGDRLGTVVEDFNNRYAELSTEVASRIEAIKFREIVPPEELARLWTANNDARNYVLLGDPAVKLAVAASGQPAAERPAWVVTPPPAAAGAPALVLAPPPPASPASVTEPAPAAEPPPPAEPEIAGTPADGEIASFDLFDRDALQQARDRLVQAVQEFVGRLGDALERAVDNASNLEVSTYVSDNMAQATSNLAQLGKLRAYTRIALDGDTTVCVPESEGAIDRDLWAIHLDMVRQAQANRSEMIKAGVSAAASLLDMLKGA